MYLEFAGKYPVLPTYLAYCVNFFMLCHVPEAFKLHLAILDTAGPVNCFDVSVQSLCRAQHFATLWALPGVGRMRLWVFGIDMLL